MGCVAASLKGQLYVVGTDVDREMTLERFDPNAFRWDMLPPLPTQRFGCAAATVAGALHVVGGHDGEVAISVSESFNPRQNLWELLPDVPTPRHGCAAAAIAGVLYVVGGDDGKSLDTVESYDPASRQWEK